MCALQWRELVAGTLGLTASGRVWGSAGMEDKSGEASAAPAPMDAASAAAAAPAPMAPPEVTLSFQSPAPSAAAPATAEKGSSSGVLVSPPAGTAPFAAAGGGGAMALGPVMKVAKKRGRPRKYAADGSLIRPLNATPISASAPMQSAMAVGQYTPASAVGAAMKRGRGRPIDFAAGAAVGKPYHHHQQQQQQFGFHFDTLGTPSLAHASSHRLPPIFFLINL